MEAVREFYPAARTVDWRLVDAGIRVQSLKKADHGAVYFGTEVFTDSHHSLAALLGASPGASVSVNIAREVIAKCFPQLLEHSVGRARMKEMLPTYDEDLKLSAATARFREVSANAAAILQLTPQEIRAHTNPVESGLNLCSTTP
jgi:malate dehydrogenase (quinone)